jgi:hypothetical protein
MVMVPVLDEELSSLTKSEPSPTQQQDAVIAGHRSRQMALSAALAEAREGPG